MTWHRIVENALSEKNDGLLYYRIYTSQCKTSQNKHIIPKIYVNIYKHRYTHTQPGHFHVHWRITRSDAELWNDPRTSSNAISKLDKTHYQFWFNQQPIHYTDIGTQGQPLRYKHALFVACKGMLNPLRYGSFAYKGREPGKNSVLTHWGRVTHICVSKLTIIASDNGLSPGRRQAIIWIIAGILLMGPLGTNFSEMSIEIQTFSLNKLHLKMSSAKWRPFVSASMC